MAHASSKVLVLLDLACREIARQADFIDACETDEACSQFGVATPYIVELCEASGIEARSTRRILIREMEAGRVFRSKPQDNGAMQWWPKGLLRQLRAEKANVKEAA